ncbi:MAG: ATP synthase F1 subunit gamma [Candidatus Hydrogenedentes bacterium]|nr:ATP synthase F1 subunit gamma [Candidatus Hydrogenedentota bacterium]
MPQAIRKIRKRVQSIGNIKKITKAMELVSTAKMRKAVMADLASRPYAELAWQILLNIAEHTETDFHPFLEHRPVRTIGVIVVSSNRGLCGVFNQQVARCALGYVRQLTAAAPETTFEFITVGKRGAQALARAGCRIVGDFNKMDTITSVAQIHPVSHFVTDAYLAGRLDRVVVAYTDFVSTLSQHARVKQLLPLPHEWELNARAATGAAVERGSHEPAPAKPFEYTFEPDVPTVLAAFLPLLFEVQLFQAMLESEASEHSARMMAMRNATEAASDLISDLTLTFNKARQAAITQELTEITNSKAALEA